MATTEQELAARVAHALLTSTNPEDDIAQILGSSPAAKAVAALVAANLILPTSGRGAASNAQAIENLILKGFYAINATTRIQSSQDKESAIRREANYHAQHVAAVDSRGTSAGAVDEAAARYGLILSYRAVLDEETTPECRAAHGKNFRADTRPLIGWPGTAHGRCRCVAGPPIAGAQELE